MTSGKPANFEQNLENLKPLDVSALPYFLLPYKNRSNECQCNQNRQWVKKRTVYHCRAAYRAKGGHCRKAGNGLSIPLLKDLETQNGEQK